MPAAKRISAKVKDRIRRMKWWHEARFGMFIHWGLYSLIGRHEWAMELEGIPLVEYAGLARRFTPAPNPARAWAKLARRAGMKYMVMTTKHHEGFCLFDTKTTDYCAPRQACGRDLVAEYVKAARAEGMRVGFYYSLMDWHHPDGARCQHNEAARRRFVDYIHAQVRELCTNYGRLDIMWYDVPWPLSAKGWESPKMNRMVRRLQPDIIINNRSKLPEDFSTPEQHITPEPPAAGRGWESCMTMNGSWGYNRGDDDWKSPKRVCINLATCAHGGGNYLLNIGPKGDGSIPDESARVLTAVGGWLKRNRRAIFTPDRCDVSRSAVANFTRRKKALYVHVRAWCGKELAVGGLRTKVRSARFLVGPKRIPFEQDRFRVKLTHLPNRAPDDPVTVIVLECASVPKQDQLAVRTGKKRGTV